MPKDAKLELYFEDNNDKTAKSTLWLPEVNAPSDHEAIAIAMASAMEPLSSARLTSAKLLYKTGISGLNPAQEGSNVYRRCVLVFRQGSNYGLLSVPSWNGLYSDVDGAYRAIRVSRERLSLLGVLPALEAAVGSLSLQWGDSFPATFSVGGVTELIT